MNQKSGEDKRLVALSLTALGVVFGDIGTSPLYALKECFHGEYGLIVNHDSVLGVLSLILWSLILVVTIKYVVFILRADNKGEGGVLALMALVSKKSGQTNNAIFVALGLFGAALLYGDGIITPAISVLSAIEGLNSTAPELSHYTIPITCAVIVVVFLLQSFGTAKVGTVFGPIVLIWFLTMGLLGIFEIAKNLEVFSAFNPYYAVKFFSDFGVNGFLVLGSVFLVATGAEALYADLGHFGRKPIQLAWNFVCLPCLILNYFGQGALLLSKGKVENPFFELVPEGFGPIVLVLATAATVIASQAVVSGAFSLSKQASQLGHLPRLRIIHTSSTEEGQIYIPGINWLLLAGSVILVVGFKTSSNLAAAYGVAVTLTMAITSILFCFFALTVWNWSKAKTALIGGSLLLVDLAFFLANAVKIPHGGWLPLVIALGVYLTFTTWGIGRLRLYRYLSKHERKLSDFVGTLEKDKYLLAPGTAVYLSSDLNIVPPALVQNLKHNHVLHRQLILLSMPTKDVPRVSDEKRIQIEEVAPHIFKVTAPFGFMETPNVPAIMKLLNQRGLQTEKKSTTFFLGRTQLLPRERGGLPGWRHSLFAFLSRNAVDATSYFGLPRERVVELGMQVEI